MPITWSPDTIGIDFTPVSSMTLATCVASASPGSVTTRRVMTSSTVRGVGLVRRRACRIWPWTSAGASRGIRSPSDTIPTSSSASSTTGTALIP